MQTSTAAKQCMGHWAARDGWLVADSPLTDAWAPCHRPRSHRQQTSSDLRSPFSTARAIIVEVIRIAVQLHASMASLSAMLSCRRPHAIKPPSPLSASEPTPCRAVRTSFMDDPKPNKLNGVSYGEHKPSVLPSILGNNTQI